jgi:hypothetical protein
MEEKKVSPRCFRLSCAESNLSSDRIRQTTTREDHHAAVPRIISSAVCVPPRSIHSLDYLLLKYNNKQRIVQVDESKQPLFISEIAVGRDTKLKGYILPDSTSTSFLLKVQYRIEAAADNNKKTGCTPKILVQARR